MVCRAGGVLLRSKVFILIMMLNFLRLKVLLELASKGAEVYLYFQFHMLPLLYKSFTERESWDEPNSFFAGSTSYESFGKKTLSAAKALVAFPKQTLDG